MNKQQEKKSITNKVLDKIKSGKIKMRPKMYFVLKTILIILTIFLVALFALFLISFIFFSLRLTGVWYLPRLGVRALGTFFVSLPWFLIFISIVFIIVLEILVRRFSFSYRRPILYSILGIIIIVILGSFIISRTRIHSDFFQRAKENRLPLTGELYRGFGMREFRDVHHGIVSEITDSGFIIETPRDEILKIVITPDPRFPSDADIKEDDVIVVFGRRDNNTVYAVGIRRINDELNIFPRPHMLRPPRW